MKRFPLLFTVLLCCSIASSSNTPKRPRIFGITRVQIFSSDLPAARVFYSKVLSGGHDCNWCEGLPGLNFSVNIKQGIGLSPDPSPPASNRMEEITFATESVSELRRYLIEKKIDASGPREKDRAAGPYLSVVDPEGHRISFIQSLGVEAIKPGYPPTPPSNLRLLHAGFVVHDRAAEDHFYKDLLGFRLYWHGGFKDDGEDWYELQVPDGTDWIEYMLNIPANADRKELGIQNHFSLGVKDIHATAEQLRKNGIDKFDGPEIGRDGKWALDVYDPDGTRIEFMEFTPAREPCCHPYTAPHPKP